MKHLNLFGEMQELSENIEVTRDMRSTYQIHKQNVNYRAGTKEKCCKTCAFCVQVCGGSRNFYKCIHIGDSRSTATDIRLRDVCDLWEIEKTTENGID